MLQRSYSRQPGQRQFLPSAYRAPGDLYASLERAGLIAARSVDAGIWYPAADLSNCWQDSARTTPCTAEGQPVGALNDMQYGIENARLGASALGYHATQATAGNRPTLVRLANGRWGLSFDGVDDFLRVPLTSSQQFYLAFAGRQRVVPPAAQSGMIGTGTGTNARMYLSTEAFGSSAGGAGSATPANIFIGSATSSPVLQSINADGANATLRRDALSTTQAYTWGTGTSTELFIGAINFTGPASYAAIDAGVAAAARSALTDPTRIAIERFAAAHAGAPYLG